MIINSPNQSHPSHQLAIQNIANQSQANNVQEVISSLANAKEISGDATMAEGDLDLLSVQLHSYLVVKSLVDLFTTRHQQEATASWLIKFFFY